MSWMILAKMCWIHAEILDILPPTLLVRASGLPTKDQVTTFINPWFDGTPTEREETAEHLITLFERSQND